MDVQLQACALATPPGTRHAHPLPVAPLPAPLAPRPSPLAPRPAPYGPRTEACTERARGGVRVRVWVRVHPALSRCQRLAPQAPPRAPRPTPTRTCRRRWRRASASPSSPRRLTSGL